MPLSRHLLPELNFILTRVYGELDDDQLKGYVRGLNSATSEFKAAREIADCRTLRGVSRLTVMGAIDAAKLEKNQPRANGGMLAIVVPKNPVVFGVARAYQMFTEESRVKGHVMYSMEDAIRWLGYTGEDAARLLEFIETATNEEQSPG